MAAEALGVDTTRYKVIAFVIGSFFAGIAGGLFAHYNAYLHPNSFTFLKSIEIIAMVVLGGLGSITGSVLAAMLLTVLPEALRSAQELRMVLYSLMLIVLMITRPGRADGQPRDRRLRRWSAARARGEPHEPRRPAAPRARHHAVRRPEGGGRPASSRSGAASWSD